jgi:hypothetical protein
LFCSSPLIIRHKKQWAQAYGAPTDKDATLLDRDDQQKKETSSFDSRQKPKKHRHKSLPLSEKDLL